MNRLTDRLTALYEIYMDFNIECENIATRSVCLYIPSKCFSSQSLSIFQNCYCDTRRDMFSLKIVNGFLSSVTLKQALRSLSLSFQKKSGLGGSLDMIETKILRPALA